MAGGTTDPADEQDGLLHFFRCVELGLGDGFDQWHPETVGPPDDEMPPVGDFATAVFLDAHLSDGQLAVAKRESPVDADDGGALESRRDGAVQILLAGDVDLVDDVATQHQTLLDGDVDSPWIDQKRWRVVHLVGTDIALVEQIDDVLPGLELHQSRPVVLAQFGQGRSHVTKNSAVVGLGVEPCRAAAEHLLLGQELLMHLESDSQADLTVVDGSVHVWCFPLCFDRDATNLSVIRRSGQSGPWICH